MRKDAQHKEFRLELLTVPVYYCSTYANKEHDDPVHWRDILEATGRWIAANGGHRNAGRSTAAVWLARWALKNLPPEVQAEINRHYLDVVAGIPRAKPAA